MKNCPRSLMLVATLTCVLLGGCGPKPGSPPVKFQYRKAQVPGNGLVAGIENTSKTETLSNFVEPEDSMTIGWVELDGWELQVDDRLSVSCEQYAEAAISTVTAP